jgi:tetratricopeptide (TPR) repeat protein
MSEELERVKARLRKDREFAEITVSSNGRNLAAWTNLTATEIEEAVREARLVLSGQKKPTGMKTLRNEKHGFEIDIPEAWSPAPVAANRLMDAVSGPTPPGVSNDSFQYGCEDEAFNFVIGPLFPEPLLDDTETEFQLYARDKGFADLHFGRILVAGKEHVWASYFINDKMGKRWNKKYMIVFGGTEYTITATCNDPQWFAKREKDWDAIIQSFRLLVPVDDSAHATDRAQRYRDKRRALIEERIEMRESTGDLYARAYEAVAVGRYAEARSLLEECIRETPDHVLAHKELAVVLKKLGNIRGAIHHRREVRRLAPSDIVNRVNLIELLAGSGKRREALRETRELLVQSPNDPVLQEWEQKLLYFRFTDYRILFFSCLAALLLLDLGLLTGGISIREVWCIRLMMIVPVGGMLVSAPWVGIPRLAAGLVAGALYLFLLMRT